MGGCFGKLNSSYHFNFSKTVVFHKKKEKLKLIISRKL